MLQAQKSPFISKLDVFRSHTFKELDKQKDEMEALCNEFKSLKWWQWFKQYTIRKKIDKKFEEINQYLIQSMKKSLEVAIEEFEDSIKNI